MRAALAIALSIATVAYAEPPMKPEAAAQRELGLREYAVGKWAEAIAAFRAAYELDPQPELLYALAQAERKSGDCAAASTTYRAFLRTSPPEAQAGTARQNLERCESELARAREQLLLQQQQSRPAAAPVRPWHRDVTAAVLIGVGGGVAAAGGALWGVGEGGLADLASATRYDDFARRAAMADAFELERGLGIGAVAVGGALVIAGTIRWAALARHR